MTAQLAFLMSELHQKILEQKKFIVINSFMKVNQKQTEMINDTLIHLVIYCW